jgi:hypothetical protein
MTSLSPSGLHRAITNGDYLTAIMLGRAAAKRGVDIGTLGGTSIPASSIKQALEVMMLHASVTCSTARTFMEFFRFSFMRFSPLHQRVPIRIHSQASSSIAIVSDVSASPAPDCASNPAHATCRMNAAATVPLSTSPFSDWIFAQISKVPCNFPADPLSSSLSGCSLRRSLLLRIFREKGKFLNRRSAGWTTLKFTLTLRHRTLALALSSLFSMLALRLTAPLSAFSAQPHFVASSSVGILRHLRGRCHSQVGCTKVRNRAQTQRTHALVAQTASVTSLQSNRNI